MRYTNVVFSNDVVSYKVLDNNGLMASFERVVCEERNVPIERLIRTLCGHKIPLSSNNDDNIEFCKKMLSNSLEIVTVPDRSWNSWYQFNTKEQLVLNEIRTRNSGFYELLLEILETEESDYVSMVAFSGLEAINKGYDPFDVEKYAHLVYRTCSGHINSWSLAPYYLMRAGITWQNVDEKVCRICEALEEYEWYKIPEYLHLIDLRYTSYCINGKFKTIDGLVKYCKTCTWYYFNRTVGVEEPSTKKFCDFIPKDRKNKIAELEELFSAKYGRVPRCLMQLSNLALDSKTIVAKFDFKRVNEYKKFVSLENAITCVMNDLNASKVSNTLVEAYVRCKDATKEWVKEHLDSNNSMLCHIMKNESLYDLAKDFKGIVQFYKMCTTPGFGDYQICCNGLVREKNHLPKVSIDGVDAYCLDLSTEDGLVEACSLGYLTHCCQHVGAAGETAMQYSLEFGEFLVFKRNGELLAQAACWESVYGEFVLDNIEFSNDRKPDCILDALREWCRRANYKDIVMGVGYNELSLDLDVESASSNGIRHPHWLPCGYVYTDISQGIVYLKKGGKTLC